MDIRTKIRTLFESSGYSIRRIAQKSGVRRQSIMHFLKGGNIHIRNLEKILSELGYQLNVSRQTPAYLVSFNLAQNLKFDQDRVAMFCQEKGISFLAVFGSVLRKDFKKDSDIDIIIKLKKPVSFFELADLEEGIRKLFRTHRRLDVVTPDSVSPLLAEEIKNTSEVIYEEAA